MKKTIAILLLLIHLFNLAGYSLVFRCLIHQSDANILRTIDSGVYDKQGVTILKTPIRLPYYNGSEQFERVEGEVVLNGTHYTYIERKVSRDTLYLVCLVNKEKTALSKSKNEFAKEVSSVPADGKKESDAAAKKTILGGEYPCPVVNYSFSAFLSFVNKHAFHLPAKLSSGTRPVPYTPPDLVS